MSLEILSMGLSPTVIGIAVPCLVVCIIYFIYRFGIGEKSFEEAIEEQKRRSIEEEIQQKLEKGKKEKKFKKSWGKRGKEKVDHDIPEPPPVLIEDKKDVPDIEIIEPKDTKSSKQKSKVKTASNVVNQAPETAVNKIKSNASPVIPNQAPETTAVEKPKKMNTISEKPVLASKKEVPESVKEIESIKVEAKVTEIPKAAAEPVENVPATAAISVQTVSVPPVTAGKKKKKEHVEKESTPLTSDKLLSFIKEMELDAEEIQALVEILLNKQKDSTGWKKQKSDQLALTKKNLQEKEQLLDQEQRQHQDVMSKLKDLREEYNQLKTKFTAQEKANKEKVSHYLQDVQTLTARVKQMQEQLDAEKEKYTQIEKETEDRIEMALKKVEEEKVKLQQKVSKLETESRSDNLKPEFDALKKSREDLQKVHNLLIEQHTQLVTSHKNDLKSLHSQLTDAKAQIEEMNAKNVILLKDIQTVGDAKAAIDSAKKSLEEKLKLEENRSADLDAQVRRLTAKVTDFTQLQTELKDLRLENERLAEQLVSTKERVAGDGQEIVHQNGEVQEEVLLKSLDEKDKLLKEKEDILTQLNEDLKKEKAKISVLSEEVEAQKQKNNELREKNWKIMDALTNTEKSADQKAKEIQVAADERITQIQQEYEEKLRLSAASSNANNLDELQRRVKESEEEATQRLSDYNNVLEKNKLLQSEIDRIAGLQQASEAKVASVEKTVKDLYTKLAVTCLEAQSESREVLQRICPNVSVDNSLPYETWLADFEEQALQIATSVSDSSEVEARYQQLIEEKEKEFIGKQSHYEKVLAETESTLVKLQESAESQEAVWQEKLRNEELQVEKMMKEKEDLVGELGDLNDKNSALTVKIEELTAEKDALVAEKNQSTFQQESQLQELQEKLTSTQKALDNAESERQHLEQRYDEVHKNCINLRDQLENKEKQILELQNESKSLDNFKQEIEDLKSKLEKEKKINKDFSSQMIRLNSLVKIGQEALTAEQEMVKKLKSQLETLQVSAANGTASATNGTTPAATTISSPVVNSESVPASKHSEKTKKKMGGVTFRTMLGRK